jgi:REP element-mobilizing transposase RayT
MREFNGVEPIGSIYEQQFGRPTSKLGKDERLVSILAYCLNPNHYHLLVRQEVEGGLSEYMKRLGGGYTKYFNDKEKRSGALFQGKYKYSHLQTDERIRYISAYVNLNYKVHRLGRWTSKSSMRQYLGQGYEAGDYLVEGTDIILSHFESPKEYENYAEFVAKEVVELREELKDDVIERYLDVGRPSG